MRVFLMGGTGQVGKEVAAKFAMDDAVSEITVASRNLAKASQAAAAIGEKANSAKADVMDERAVSRMIEGYDLFVNASGPDYRVQPHAIRAAIDAGVNYCDVSCDGQAADEVLELDDQAKDAGMTAIIGIGWMPGLTNLSMMHASSQLDRTETVRGCLYWPMPELLTGDTRKIASELRDAGPYSASWETAMRCYSGPCRTYREGRWSTVEPFDDGMVLAHPGGGSVKAYPSCSAESVTVPRYLPGVKNIQMMLTFSPFPLNELARQLASRIRRGDLDTKEAALSFIETAGSDPDRWFAYAEKKELELAVWIEAIGIKDDVRTRYVHVQNTEWPSTGGPLYTAGMKLLRRSIDMRGILPPEACLDPLPFMREVACTAGWPEGKKLFEESFERLD